MAPPMSPDERRRELRRRAEAGDIAAGDQLEHELVRTGEIPYEFAVGLSVVRRGPIHDWRPYFDYPGAITLHSPEDDSLFLIATPWGGPNTAFSPLDIHTADGRAVGITDILTPRTGNIARDAGFYRRSLSLIIEGLGLEGLRALL